MFIRLLAPQIPLQWNEIKYAVGKTMDFEDGEVQKYYNKLLIDLLCNKAQCFIRYNKERILQAIVITRFSKNEITGEKALSIDHLYSFEVVDIEEWNISYNLISKFALANNCKSLIAYSSNQRVFDIIIQLGFSERFRCLISKL